MKLLSALLLVMTFSVGATEVSLLTYNLGLAHSFVALAKERVPHLSKALATSESDIVCLQEVWKKSDRKKISKALKKIYPFSYTKKRSQQRASHAPVCKIKELFGKDKFLTCMLDNCMDGDADHQTTCSRITCGPSLVALRDSNQECATTLMAQVGKSTIMSMYTIFEPFVRPGMFAYRGDNGLMLFSKYPMSNKKFFDWKKQSTLNYRGALTANVEIDGNKLFVACSHLTANLDRTIPYTGNHHSWESENLLQVEDFISKVENINTPIALMGDFNCSFGDPSQGVESDFENNCSVIVNAGFSDPTSEQHLEATFSLSNTLVDPNEREVALDHIFIKNGTYSEAEVILKDVVEITKKDEVIMSNISDHYGLRVIMQL